ncbi:MAG: 4a-hydroxytetrahydrobiopterin dehydratase [Cellvibrionales bacterium]|nr:4a-hydroxytetrahydrobiopterin dehydratase [Cellvibrionales bacterium]
MPKISKLDKQQITAALAELNRNATADWRLADGKLQREFVFADFAAAFAFMERVAADTERLDHHPDWRNVYNRVEVALWTHDAQGISERDFALARCMEAAATDA